MHVRYSFPLIWLLARGIVSVSDAEVPAVESTVWDINHEEHCKSLEKRTYRTVHFAGKCDGVGCNNTIPGKYYFHQCLRCAKPSSSVWNAYPKCESCLLKLHR
ncbi:hypothetical protein PCANC_28329 [Puccinia coronata f. sp. avenae]|uniref:Uncharacterized protein n=1 Tax=Puccinia coronata f. sp. avenae TaxID=200324 RepID=A0A2N5RUT9_9BASI|nr:hypothetical protein PCANC_28329 [Puccinia coronata f. sp. avenae]